MIEIGEGDAVSLLKMAESARLGDVGEETSPVVSEREIRHQHLERDVTRPEVEIEITVVVEITEIRPHRMRDPVEAEFGGPIDESSPTITQVMGVRFAADRQTQIVRGNVGNVGVVTESRDVEPAVVVEIPEEHGKACDRPLDAEFRGDIRELQVAEITVKSIWTAEIGNVNVELPVAVVVAGNDPLGEASVFDSG